MMKTRIALLAVMLICLVPSVASAYVGPGSGITVIGAALAFVASAFLAIAGFVWYPVKRMLALRRRAREKSTADRHVTGTSSR